MWIDPLGGVRGVEAAVMEIVSCLAVERAVWRSERSYAQNSRLVLMFWSYRCWRLVMSPASFLWMAELNAEVRCRIGWLRGGGGMLTVVEVGEVG